MEDRRNSKEPNTVSSDPVEYTNDPSGVHVHNLPQQERRQVPPGRWDDALHLREPSPVRRMDPPEGPHRA